MTYANINAGELGSSVRSKINGVGNGLDTHISNSGSVVHGLGTISTQSASAVSIRGGSLTGTTVSSASLTEISLTSASLVGITVPVTSASADLTLTANHYVVLTSGSSIISLPTAVGITGRIYHIKNIGTGTISITASGSQMIDDASTKTITSQYTSLQIVSDGSGWSII